MKRRIIALLAAILLLLTSVPLTASAAEGAQVVAENAKATQGGYAYVYLRADHFVDVAVLDIEVYYDSTRMSVSSVTNGSMLTGASVSVNKDTVGVVKISAMSVAGFNSGTTASKNRLVSISFKVLADCPVGEYPIRVTVGDAYDSEFSPTAIAGSVGMVTVSAAAPKSFPIYTSKDVSEAKQGDTVTVTAYHLRSYTFASADFHIEYDRELLRVTGVELDSALKAEGVIHSVNAANPGLAVISLAATKAISCSNFFKITFEVVANTNATASIKIEATDVYSDELVMYAPSSVTTTVTLSEREVLPDYPDLTVGAGQGVVGKPMNVTVTLQGGAPVAAGDFTVTYDPAVFAVGSVTAGETAVNDGALIFINNNYHGGEIKFSYVNQQGRFDEDTVLLDIVLTPIASPEAHYVLSAEGSGVCDLAYEDVVLDCVSASDCLWAGTVVPPACEDEGYTHYVCGGCGDSYTDEATAAVGHTYGGWVLDKVATSTEEGQRHKTCVTCGAVMTETLPTAAYTLVRKGKTLEYKDRIYVKVVFDLAGIDLTTVDLENGAGLLCWTQEEFAALDRVAFDEEHALVGMALYPGTKFYFGKSDGFFTRYLADVYYYVGYVRLPDGSYMFSEPELYGPTTYAYNMLGKEDTKEKTKVLCVALLNYIAAAQRYFYPTIAEEALANAGLSSEQKSLTWDDAPENFTLASAIPADKQVAADTAVFLRSGKNLRFQEMISLISAYQIRSEVVANAAECGTVFWTAEQFAALEGAPSIENIGDGSIVPLETYSGENMWCSVAPAVAAKDMADTEYFILGYVKHADGSVSYSGVMSYSFEQYIYNKAADSGTSAEMLEFAKRLYVYERAARSALK